MSVLPYKLQLTNGFFADFTQLARVLAYAAKHQANGRISFSTYAMEMGISARRAENLCSLATAFELVRPTVLIPTPLGLMTNRYDPYFENVDTLWLLHYLVSSNERNVVWNRLVNQVIPDNDRFSTILARPYFTDLNHFYSEGSIDKHLAKEIRSVWNAYTEQAFHHLDYIRTESDLIYVRGKHEPISAHIFFAAILSYQERFAPGVTTLEISQLINSVNSPGRAFGMNSRQVRDILEEVKNLGYIYIETRADLDQIRFRDNASFLEVIRRYYEER